jgi:hypothetical protein
MILFVVSFACFGLAMLLMAVGVLAGRGSLAVGCGRGVDCGCRRSE